jgi:NadR type nicotinamide-nucleotide adenylyltransferase
LKNSIKKIVIIGPESSGKSTLTQALAQQYHTLFAPEYARQYLEILQRHYTQDDLWHIAQGQLKLEDEQAQKLKSGLLFCDTDLYVIKVWSEEKYGSCASAILEHIATRRYDFYLLTDTDMPWQYDPLREHPQPEMRQYFFRQYLDIVQNSGVPFAIIKGNEKERLQIATSAIDKRFGAGGKSLGTSLLLRKTTNQ